MGLSISVGLLHDQARNDPEGLDYHRRAFARLGRALAAQGVDWHEPPIAGPPHSPTFSGGFPYGYLTQLRRIVVLVGRGEPVTPAASIGEQEWDRDCEKIRDETSMFSSHLLCHADNAGYYVPVDFADPLFLPPEAEVAGAGMVGSAQRLLAELSAVAPALGIGVDAGGLALGPQETGPAGRDAADEPFESERFAWHQLHRACLASVTGGYAVVFH
ncbi:hypothetical protein ACFWOG_36240 [Kitasatospora sp. NPDC058406]|uniref:hypothetical protein n=1 Tax=Kitasatospora sp. NPDC058406 TaxID=3346483 RepID=UPI00365EB842